MRNLKCPLCNAEYVGEIPKGMTEVICENCKSQLFVVSEILDKTIIFKNIEPPEIVNLNT